MQENEYMLIVNYFGQLSNDELNDFSIKYQNIIIDNTQSFYSKKIENILSFNSCRKFFGVPDGSYLYTDKILDKCLEVDKSLDRMQHLLGRYESNASSYYNLFTENNRIIANQSMKQMSKLTQNLLKGIDYDEALNKRNCNFNFLFNELNKINKLKIKKIQGAFCYPLYIENGDSMRSELIKQKIYTPLLWPEVINKEGVSDLEVDMANNIVHLPCDQRYDIDDMKKVVKEVKKCLNLEN